MSLKETEGKVIAVVFWAMWSPRSRSMLDDLEKVYQIRKDRGLAVIAVNVEHESISSEDRSEIGEWARGWSYPVLLDEGLSVYSAYGVVATPSIVLVDDSGTIRYLRASYSSGARLEIAETIDELLGVHVVQEDRKRVEKRSYVPPKRATLHYQKAQVLLRRGNIRRAIADLEAAAELDPNWPDPRLSLARLYMAEGKERPERLDRADILLGEALQIRPESPEVMVLKAQIAGLRGDHEGGIKLALQALGQEPAYIPAFLALAKSQRALRNFDQGMEWIRKALELDPENPRLLRENGELSAARGDWMTAATMMRTAVEAAWERAGGIP